MQKIETPATSALLAEKKDAVMCLMQEACEKKLDCLRDLDKKHLKCQLMCCLSRTLIWNSS